MKECRVTNIEQAKASDPTLVVFGDGDAWHLLCKVSSKRDVWMKSTKAMPVLGTGCLVQVTTEFQGQVAEALTFVPGACILEACNEQGLVVERQMRRAPEGVSPGVVLVWDKEHETEQVKE